MAHTIQLKQAMPTEEDRSIVLDVLHWLAAAIEDNVQFDSEGNDSDITDEEIVDRLRLHFTSAGRNFGSCWQRVVYAGLCALDNACDPNADVLEWKPEIAQALQLASVESEESETARSYAARWGYDDNDQMFMLELNDQAPTGLATIALSSGQVSAETTVTIAPGVEIRIPIMVIEGEWISGRMTIDGKLVDTFGCRVAIVTCPHCSNRIDKPPRPPVPDGLITQPEHAIGKEGVQSLAEFLDCDPSEIVHVKRAKETDQ